jgi:uncharacterized protein
MIPEIATLYLVIFLFSVVQSIFGIGLLLFGTPTLLLMGYSYPDIFWILLPASITISFIQMIRGHIYVKSSRKVYLLMIPPLVVCLVFVLLQGESFDISKIVGIALLLVGAIRCAPRLQEILKRIIDGNINAYYVLIGAIHGISNMGGGPLSVLMTTIHSKKNIIRANIAFVYLIFGIFQLLVVAVISPQNRDSSEVGFCIIAFVSYFVVGRFLARTIDDRRYQELITVVILMYGFLMVF